MSRDIKISVIMPAYRAEKYIQQAIDSVFVQSVPLELIVVIDGSGDFTQRIVEEYKADKRIRIVVNETNLGVAESRNVGIRLARGKYIAFLDADDWWAEGKLAAQYKLMEKSGAVLCCTARELMREDGSASGRKIAVPEIITYPMILRTNCIPCSSVMVKTEIAREFYMCHDELHEDYILWLRILKKYKEACGINVPYLKSRMSEGGKSRNKLKSAKMQLGVYRFMGYGKMSSFKYFILYVFHGIRKYM